MALIMADSGPDQLSGVNTAHCLTLSLNKSLKVGRLVKKNLFNPFLHGNAFRNIMENETFAPLKLHRWSICSIFHNIFKSVQDFT